ncbi:hypothetical protein QZH41_019863 [Actinostola sp. cb2023]|nr:hypothetical protein QZH41_019863 [Actinostola sp. cb2023]
MSQVTLQKVSLKREDLLANSIAAETIVHPEPDSSSTTTEAIRNKTSATSLGIADPILATHCSKTPELSEAFISLFHALKLLKEEIGKEQFYLNPNVQKQAFVLNDFYTRQKVPSSKVKLAEFLADTAFVSVVKDIFVKLTAACPDIYSYDREMDKTTKNHEQNSSVSLEENQRSVITAKPQDLFLVTMNASVNYTKRCDAMVTQFTNIGLVPVLLDIFVKLKDCTVYKGDLVVSRFVGQADDLKSMTIRASTLLNVMATLLGLSTRVPTRPTFHTHNAVQVLLPMMEHRVDVFAALALLILAYILNEDYNFLIMAYKGPIKYLISLIDRATQASSHKANGASNRELADGLAQIAINDSNKKQIVINGAIPVLTRMINAAKNEEEEIAGANVLWTLAFDHENRQQMRRDDQCMKALTKLKDSGSKNVQKVASGALWEIEGKHNYSISACRDCKPTFFPGSKQATKNHVMISYQWDVQKTMIQLKNRLQAAGFRVWMDLEQMGGSTLEAMARAVEDSAVVLVCVSQKYKESSNCRSEAEYAFQLKKDIVPLMMEGNYRPDGWLGIIMGSKLWINFSRGLERLETSCLDLEKELGFRGKNDNEDGQVPGREVYYYKVQ